MLPIRRRALTVAGRTNSVCVTVPLRWPSDGRSRGSCFAWLAQEAITKRVAGVSARATVAEHLSSRELPIQ